MKTKRSSKRVATRLPIRFCAVCVCLGLWGSVGQTRADDQTSALWPQWRGPDRTGRLHDGSAWPDSLETLERRWRVELGPGYAGPIVAADRVFVAETQDETWEVVRAFERRTGEQIWTARWKGAMSVPFFAKANGDWIRSTPAYDGESLFVAGIRDVLVCLDADTGTERWRVDFVDRYNTPLPAFGFVCSPLVVGDHVYVQAAASFVKLDKRTGRTVWRALEDGGGMYGSAFSSPILATLHGTEQLIVQTRQYLCGVDPESGDMLWMQTVPSYRGMNILTPTVYDDSIFTSTHRNKSFLYQIVRSDDRFEVEQAWTNRGQGYMSSPVRIGDFAYLHLGNGRLSCVHLHNGETQWRSKPLGKYWSMVAKGNRILGLNDRGELFLVRARPEAFDLLDQRRVSDQETWAHLAVAGSELFVRELKGIVSYRWSSE